MKTTHAIIGALVLSLLVPFAATPAAALSCLPTADYLKDVVGNEDIVIFEATSLDRIEETGHTVEVLAIHTAHQGYLDDKLFAYHEKHPDWGYLCNSGPVKQGTKSIYVASRNDHNQFFVHQRLDLTDPLVTTLKADIKKAEVEGAVSPIAKTDRLNQIKTSIGELLAQIGTLLREFSYWSKQ